jgi:hypothetical protein
VYNETYLTTTNDGLQVNLMGMRGGRLTLWNPSTGAWEVRSIQFGGQPNCLQHCFNGSAYVDGVANQSLVNGKVYYVYMFLPAADQTIPRFNFCASLHDTPQTRYGFTQEGGHPYYIDGQGNTCTLVGMAFPLNSSIGSVLGGANCRILTSSSPWGAPSQPLPANSTQMGCTFSNTSPAEIKPELGIYACQWAWRGARSHFNGRIADGSIGSPCAVFLRPFAKSIVHPTQIHYGPTIIAQFPGVGYNLPLGGSGVSLALDDGAYYYGIEGWVTGGAAHIQLEHIVEGWI